LNGAEKIAALRIDNRYRLDLLSSGQASLWATLEGGDHAVRKVVAAGGEALATSDDNEWEDHSDFRRSFAEGSFIWLFLKNRFSEIVGDSWGAQDVPDIGGSLCQIPPV
jgi:hypothetical protein